MKLNPGRPFRQLDRLAPHSEAESTHVVIGRRRSAGTSRMRSAAAPGPERCSRAGHATAVECGTPARSPRGASAACRSRRSRRGWPRRNRSEATSLAKASQQNPGDVAGLRAPVVADVERSLSVRASVLWTGCEAAASALSRRPSAGRRPCLHLVCRIDRLGCRSARPVERVDPGDRSANEHSPSPGRARSAKIGGGMARRACERTDRGIGLPLQHA